MLAEIKYALEVILFILVSLLITRRKTASTRDVVTDMVVGEVRSRVWECKVVWEASGQLERVILRLKGPDERIDLRLSFLPNHQSIEVVKGLEIGDRVKLWFVDQLPEGEPDDKLEPHLLVEKV